MKKKFCRYCLQAFSTEEILKGHIKDYFKINGKQKIIMPEKVEYVKFRNYDSWVNWKNINMLSISEKKQEMKFKTIKDYEDLKMTYHDVEMWCFTISWCVWKS